MLTLHLAPDGRLRQPTALSRVTMRKIRIAIVGVGNCASSLVQGTSFYRDVPTNGASVGLMHSLIGPYRPSDITVVAAFDIDRRKVGRDVNQAIFAPPNCTKIFCADDRADRRDRQDGLCPRWIPGTHMDGGDPMRTFQPLKKESTRRPDHRGTAGIGRGNHGQLSARRVGGSDALLCRLRARSRARVRQ